MDDKEKKTKSNKKTTQSNKPKKPNKDFRLSKQIKEEKAYKYNVEKRDAYARKYVEENYPTKTKKHILPGQLIMFNYFEPKTKEELEYYDAMPCTIFFGITNTSNGKRVIGFNIHYYPPRIRYKLMDRIFDIFRPLYIKSWDKTLNKEIENFNYKLFIEQLKEAKLDFGVRMYDPSLMASVAPIPPSGWSKAVFTEGRFKKRTREAIMKYWNDKKTSLK